MPSRLNPADRRLLTIAGAALLVLIAGTVVVGPTSSDDNGAPSIYSTSSGGAHAAWLLLRGMHYNVRAWEEPLTSLKNVPGNALLILAEPDEAPSAHERAALNEFVTRGGKVLFCGYMVNAFFSHAATPFPTADIEWREFRAILPGLVSRNARTISMRTLSKWRKRTPSQLWLYGDENSAAVVDWRIGAGHVLWWAGATPLTNAGITRSGNLNFFLNSVTDSSGARPAIVLWDEYFHGERTGLFGYVAKTPVMWAMVQILIAGLAVLFTFSRRSGPIVAPVPVSRLSPLEFVETMGGLYQRAGAASIPVEISYRHLRFLLTRRLGVAATVSEGDLARMAERRFGLPGAQLADDLRAGSSYCFDTKISARNALTLVKRLEGYAAQLDPAISGAPLPLTFADNNKEKY